MFTRNVRLILWSSSAPILAALSSAWGVVSRSFSFDTFDLAKMNVTVTPEEEDALS